MNTSIALATEANDTLTSIMAGLADLQERLAVAAHEEEDHWTRMIEDKMAYIEWQLADNAYRAVARAADYVKSYRKDIENAVRDHADAISRFEARCANEAHQEKAKSINHIDSGFRHLNSNVVLERGKPTNRAAVLFMIEGNVFEATVTLNENTRELRLTQDCFLDTERVVNHSASMNGKEVYKLLFWPDMTDEDIAKAAHLRQQIINTAYMRFNELPKRKRA